MNYAKRDNRIMLQVHVIIVGALMLALMWFASWVERQYQAERQTDRCPMCQGEGRVPKMKEVTP